MHGVPGEGGHNDFKESIWKVAALLQVKNEGVENKIKGRLKARCVKTITFVLST